MVETQVRRAQLGDAAALALVGQASFLETYTELLPGDAIVEHCQRTHSVDDYRRWLKDPQCAIWLAETTPCGAPIGYAVVTPPDLADADATRDLELQRIYLLHRYQGRGLGHALLRQAADYATHRGAARLLLGVYVRNTVALRFYRKHGFTDFSTRKFHVGSQWCDDYVLSLALPGPPLPAES
ncbi:MAG TPA: GNAT family N-acetyltransferase [Nevskiaceae bacterium]|nr:GNAT family N-acetyltransferase [Nevskiaceae bacterium]